MNKVKAMLQLDPDAPGKVPEHIKENIEKYGLGTKRTLQAYYDFAGIDVANKTVSKNFCAKPASSQGGNEGFSNYSNYSTDIDWLMYIVLACLGLFLLNLVYFNIDPYVNNFRRWFAVNRRYR